jgi:peptide/nickel transport system permease protein
VGGGLVLAVIVVAALAPLLATADPLKMSMRERFAAPGAAYWLGTDHFGRDVWSRLVFGARLSLAVSVAAVGLGLALGVPLGAVSGYARARVDQLLMRAMDALLAFPPILLALAVVAVLGPGLANTAFAIGLVYIPRLARIVRASVLQEREKEYVAAARVLGDSDGRILFGHILPNCLSPLLVQGTAYLAAAVLVESSLSFLGLGAPPPAPSWGAMLSDARGHLESYPLVAIFPGLAISLTVLGFNLLGDGLRDILDPRLAEPR